MPYTLGGARRGLHRQEHLTPVQGCKKTRRCRTVSSMRVPINVAEPKASILANVQEAVR